MRHQGSSDKLPRPQPETKLPTAKLQGTSRKPLYMIKVACTGLMGLKIPWLIFRRSNGIQGVGRLRLDDIDSVWKVVL